jgi:hypothetical protein
VFVVGCGRSGTTVLRTVLDAHPAVAVAHEAGFVAPVGLRRARYERPDGFDVDRFVADLDGRPAIRGNLGFGPADLRGALDGDPIADVPDAVRRIFASYAARRGKHRYGDKMPGYVLRIDLLAGMFPEARFVHIIRDGRDVALSAMAIPGTRDGVVAHSQNWRTRVTEGQRAGERLGPDRYREVRYEALVAEPEAEVAGLCSYLDLEYDPAMLRFFERRRGVPDKLAVNPRHARLAEPLSAGTRSWRTHMEGRDLERFEAVAGGLLERLGYERAAERPGVAARARATWGWCGWQVSRLAARVPGMVRRTVRRD